MDTFFEGIFWIGFMLTFIGGGVLICHGIGRLWERIKYRLLEWILGVRV